MKLIRKTKVTLTKNGNKIYWAIFWCDFCKTEVEKEKTNGLKQQSCGCHKNVIHGGSYTKLYHIWVDIKKRCFNLKTEHYKDYGGRGITICNEWLEYIPFRDWALSNGYAEGLEIDRKDNDGNYEPNNCQWINRKENGRKTRRIKLTLEKANEIRTLYNSGYCTQKQLAKKYKIDKSTVSLIMSNKIWYD